MVKSIISKKNKNFIDNIYEYCIQATQGKDVLILKPLKYLQYEDKEMFYNWLDEVRCVSNYTGIGRKEVHAGINPEMQKNISYEDFVNLYGLFKRYKLNDINQLKKLFINKNNKHWFEPRAIKKKSY